MHKLHVYYVLGDNLNTLQNLQSIECGRKVKG